ncbi:MAG: S8 family serine peptidase, partial [Calditrichaeota bacterium]|nr:S8 family serine peptidase [Calditrichota bacterium]
MEKERRRGQERSGKELADLNNYYRLVLSPNENSSEFVNSLNTLNVIEVAYAEPIVGLPIDIDPETADFTNDQGYLFDAPEGINAPAAWELDGGRGENVKIIDIEGGWNFDHEDLKEPFYSNLDEVEPQWEDHGDAVIGILIGQHNEYGIDGICPEAEIGGHSTLEIQDDPNIANAINSVAAELDEGDIFLIELHALFLDIYWSPVETWQANFDAIETATANGIVCVEAAGNGAATSLDDNIIYQGRFNPENRHSGAIMVGAGVSPLVEGGVARSRCLFSNFGERLDLQGWGDAVTSSGYGDLFFPNGDVRQWYTGRFGGTSSASAIVAGAVVCVQGIYKARANGASVLSAQEIRDILVETGTPQRNFGIMGHIGPQPNLTNIGDQIHIPVILHGSVRDIATDEMMPGVEIISDHGLSTLSDEEGLFSIATIRNEIEFSLTAHIEGYNDSTVVELVFEEEDSLEVNFGLLHPEFLISLESLEESLELGESSEHEFNIENNGNGPLFWSVKKSIRSENHFEPGELKHSLFVGDSLDDSRIKGVIFVNNKFYVSGANHSHPTIYILDRDGALIDTFAQPGDNERGMKDLTFDGELIWGTIQNIVYGMTPEGEIVSTFESPYNPTNNIAWDSNRECLWISSTASDPVAYTGDGDPFENLQIDR